MEILQGEQFTRYITGTNIDYDTCSQIVLRVYEKTTGKIALTFVKVADEETYSGAELLTKSDTTDYKLKVFITSAMTKELNPGIYCMEAKRVISGEDQPIIKGVQDFFTVKVSRT
jgi:hypothetical protein